MGNFFSPVSVWNTRLPAVAALDPDSPACAAEVRRQVTGWGTGIMTADYGGYGVPIYTVPADQPTVRVALDGSASPLLQSAFDQVPVPVGTRSAAGQDANVAVWQPSTDTLWEFWHFRSETDGFHAGYGGRMVHVSQSNGSYADVLFDIALLRASYPRLEYVERWYWGCTSAKFSLLAGIITLDDLARGAIQHALCVSLPQCAATIFRAPAQATDGRYDGPHAIPQGAHLRLDPNLNLTPLNLSPLVHMMAKAAQWYGIIVVNTGGAVGFRGEDPTTGADPWPALLGPTPGKMIRDEFPWDSLQMLAA